MSKGFELEEITPKKYKDYLVKSIKDIYPVDAELPLSHAEKKCNKETQEALISFIKKADPDTLVFAGVGALIETVVNVDTEYLETFLKECKQHLDSDPFASIIKILDSGLEKTSDIPTIHSVKSGRFEMENSPFSIVEEDEEYKLTPPMTEDEVNSLYEKHYGNET